MVAIHDWYTIFQKLDLYATYPSGFLLGQRRVLKFQLSVTAITSPRRPRVIAPLSISSQEGSAMQGFYTATRGELPCLLTRSFDAVQLFCLLGVTISIAVVLHLDVDGLGWILANIE
jgi:hypothetical protein